MNENQERMLNLGEEITLKKLGTIVVKEPSLENVIVLLQDISVVFGSLDMSNEGWIKSLISNELTLISFKKIIATCTQKTVQDFNDLGIGDWIKVVAALKKVINWEEIKEIFFQIVPRETLENMMKKGG